MLRPGLLDKVVHAFFRYPSAIPAAGARNAGAVSGCPIAWHVPAQRPSQPRVVHRLLGQNLMNMGVRAGTGKKRQNSRGLSL